MKRHIQLLQCGKTLLRQTLMVIAQLMQKRGLSTHAHRILFKGKS